MELKFSKISNRKESIVDMFIYDLLGIKDEETGRYFDGNDFARELRWVGQNYDQVNVHINCDGGLVSHGLSIKAAFADVPAKIVTINDGVCASMGTMLLMNGDEVEVKDYAKTMFHMAYLIDEKGKRVEKVSARQQEGLDMCNDTLFRLIKKRGKTDEEARTIITPIDKWFTPEDLQANGLVDRIIDTGRKKELAGLEPMKLVAKLKLEKNTNFLSMKKVIARLNGFGLQLAEDANEDQVVAAMVGLQVGESEKPSAKLVDTLIAIGKKTGAVTDGETGNEAKFRKLAEADMELFVDLLGIDQLSTAPAPKATPELGKQARMSVLIAQASTGSAAVVDEKDFAWYEKNDSKALAKMEQMEPEKFAKLQAADTAKYQ
jgi:ATP-dependent protease ClpP protease subunit